MICAMFLENQDSIPILEELLLDLDAFYIKIEEIQQVFEKSDRIR